jgi:hypothetical protein
MQIGLVGLQYSGKTTLFNTLSKKTSESSQVKEEAAIEVVKVPDDRLDKLTSIFNPKKQINATIEVFDIPGLKMSDDNKVKITSGFLSGVKNNDALFYVIRGFNDDGVAHPMKSVNPKRDIEFLNTEFLLSDMAFLESRLEKLKKDILKLKDDKVKRELSLLEKCLTHCETESPLNTLHLDENEIKLLSGYQLLTLKPLAIAINYDENSIHDVNNQIEQLKKEFEKSKAYIIPFFAKIELELSKLNDDDRDAFMQDYGIKDSALNRILRISYELLGLQSFFTVGEDECRAWTIKKNFTAQQAAGVIHTDFFNKFIRAEVVHYEDFLKYGSFSKCKEAGTWRLEGKEYIVKDGDILNIRHS